MGTRVLLADDHKMFRDGLRPLLENLRGVEVVGEASNGIEAVARSRDLHPDVVILDISMPQLNGVEATRRIRELENPPRVVILSMHSDRRFVLETLRAGATGYLLKDSAFEELAETLRVVLGGGVHLSRQLSEAVIQDYVQLAEPEAMGPFSRLSPREREVLQLIAEGSPTRTIADTLCVSVKTVETHRRQIMEKLDLHSVAELTRYAIREGIVPLD